MSTNDSALVAKSPNQPELAIWWTSNEEADELFQLVSFNKEKREHIWPLIFERVPQYIRDEFFSRAASGGRGRLWGPQFIDFEGIPDFELRPLAWLCQKRAGIIIYAQDAGKVRHLLGFLTDTELNWLIPTE